MKFVDWVSSGHVKRMETAQRLYDVAWSAFFYVFGLMVGGTIGNEIGKMLAGDAGILPGSMLGLATWFVLLWKITKQNRP